MKTAVDFFYDHYIMEMNFHGEVHLDLLVKLYKEAKAMERNQIGDAYVHGAAYGINIKEGMSPHNYYHEKFNSK